MASAGAVDSGDATPRMAFGRFFGRVAEKREVDGFTLARFIPTVPKSEVQRHRHEEAHFVFVLRGSTRPVRSRRTTLPRRASSTARRGRSIATAFPRKISRGRRSRLCPSPLRLRRGRIGNEAAGRGSLFAGVGDRSGAATAPSIGARGHDDLSSAVTEALCLELLQRTGARDPAVSGAPGWLRRARELLRDTCFDAGPKSVAEIAGELGFTASTSRGDSVRASG